MNDQRTSKHWLLTFIAASALIALAITVGAYLWYFNSGISTAHATWGEFGDYFGGLLNPILSFLALLALLGTLYYQRLQLDTQVKELENSKEELRETRIELRKSAEHQEKSAQALSAQTELISSQAFDTTFFQLLNLHHQLVNGLELRDSASKETIARGRDTFVKLYKYLSSQRINMVGLDGSLEIEKLYEQFYESHGHKIGHYFRNLYRIFKILHESNSPKEHLYASVLRAQLSNHELLLLFYNGLSKHGVKFVKYIEEYSLLNNIPADKLLFDGAEKPLYRNQAFEKSEAPT